MSIDTVNGVTHESVFDVRRVLHYGSSSLIEDNRLEFPYDSHSFFSFLQHLHHTFIHEQRKEARAHTLSLCPSPLIL